MTSVLTWQQLRDLTLTELDDAADGWAAVARRADAAGTQVDGDMAGTLSKSQESESAKSAVGRLKRLSGNFDYLRTECGLIRSAVNGLSQELAAPKRRLGAALDDAGANSYTVNEDGSVAYPSGGKNAMTGGPNPGGTAFGNNGMLAPPGASNGGLHGPRLGTQGPYGPGLGGGPTLTPGGGQPIKGVYEPNPHQARAQEIADSIAHALREAREIDGRYQKALGELKAAPGLTVDAKTWADMAADAGTVRSAARTYLLDEVPLDKPAAARESWWAGLSQEQREEYLAVYPDVIGNLDGIPSVVRDEANRENLQLLIAKLEGQGDEKSQSQLGGLKEIDRQLQEGSRPPMMLLGIGDEGNGRAIVSYGNPDTSKNVSAYVPGLGTALDSDFAKNDLKRARDTAIGAREYDQSSASIVWLGYDAPQLPDNDNLLHSGAVMSSERAEKGAPAYNSFMSGLSATNENDDPHVTSIGHSYGSRTVGAASQLDGGIPGADDIILIGSPGVGVDRAEDMGVGKENVYVGAAENDPVSKLPSKGEAAAGTAGFFVAGPLGSYLAGDLADPGDDDLWFGKDPASEAFGAQRFAVDDGPRPIVDGEGATPAHSNYFNPEKDPMSADNIAKIVAGQPETIDTERHR
ncbi:alpha/beta hydrolase [Streptomyces uncialis]|uniref:alpha/beta hydrolase n=1 Tax=Streptomyces uncialis TaxID=1048205 RepID=UPI003866C1B6|nr:alpha/beta hydrolase family protein [Streptomyces uncialis]